MASRTIDISIQLPPRPGRPHLVIEGSALVCFDAFHSPHQDEHMLRLNGVQLTRAIVNDELLDDEALHNFELNHRPDYDEELEWLALSSVH